MAGVMAGRATQRIRQPLTFQQQRGTGQGGIGGRASGAIGAGDDRRAQIEAIVAGCTSGPSEQRDIQRTAKVLGSTAAASPPAATQRS